MKPADTITASDFRAGQPDAAATRSDEIQLLFHPTGEPVGKHFVADATDPRGFREAGDDTGGSKRQTWYVPGKARIENVDDLFDFVSAAAARPDILALGAKPSRAICRDGVIRYPSKVGPCLRATKYGGGVQGKRGHFEPAARRSIFFDLDETPIPADMARTDPKEAARQIVEHCRADPFASATAVVRFSSSCGLSGDCVKAQVWFLTDRAVSGERIEKAVHAINERAQVVFGIGKLADDAAPRPVQKRYVGGAIYEGVEDPLPRRVVLVDAGRERVRTDDLPALDPTKSAKSQKGRKASTSLKRAKTDAPKPVRTVPDYEPYAASLPADVDLICQASGNWGDKARGIERLVHLRFAGRAPSGWRDLMVFWATNCAVNAEGNVSGRRVLQIAETYRSRYAPDMNPRKMNAYMGSLAQRADADATAAKKSRNGRLSKSAVQKYTPTISCLVQRLLVGPQEQSLIPELRSAASRKAASRKASTPTEPNAIEEASAAPTRPRTETMMSGLSKMKRAAANTEDSEPFHEAEGKATGGLSAMKRTRGQAWDEDPTTRDGNRRTKRAPVGEPPRLKSKTPKPPKRDIMDILTSDDTVIEPEVPPEEPSVRALAWRMGPEITSEDVRELMRRASTDKRSARRLEQARELYRRWREAEIDRIRNRAA